MTRAWFGMPEDLCVDWRVALNVASDRRATRASGSADGAHAEESRQAGYAGQANSTPEITADGRKEKLQTPKSETRAD